MLEDLGPLLKKLPPRTASALGQAINRCAAELGVGPDWVQRWIGFMVVADALARYAPDGQPAFELKGGAAIELRLGRPVREGDAAGGERKPTAGARATRDLDATFRGVLDDLEAAVRSALAEPRHPFAFRVELEQPNPEFMRRFRIRVGYREVRLGRVMERSFSNVKLEVSPYEGRHVEPDRVPAFSLKPFGLDGPNQLPCIPLTKQVAQKLHAATEPAADGKVNDRFRDLLDLALLSALVPPSRELREVCEETFAIRGKHPWPPEITAYPHWIEPLEQKAAEMGLPEATAAEIVQHVTEYVRLIAAA
ncbi:MAG: nucleotidyl transferase AbiEii/AbiGii toxin family protein [Longimicrobiales bacterium]|nr:nucleotidyl transferase AbiEii/AbiGii toxin family protein [Longimicrobiales bacterium]